MRSLLAPGHSHGGRAVEVAEPAGHNHAAHDHGPVVEPGHEPTLDLRIISIFVILAGTLLFGLPPLLMKRFQNPDAVVPRLLRAFAGGVILALSLVHIIPSAVGELNSLMDFPIGGVTILFGILALIILDSTLAAVLAPEEYKAQIRSSVPSQARGGKAPCLGSHHGSSAKAKAGAADADTAAAEEMSSASQLAGRSAAAAASHSHQCMRSLNASSFLAGAAAPLRNLRQYVTAYTMELGCIFHSVIIGVGVGVIAEGRALIVTLMIALAFHQGLEALALGSVLALTSFHWAKRLAMLLLYSVTTPIGIAVGIAVSEMYSPDSVTSRAVQGTLNGVSGGMLLYIGFYQLIAEEFSREDMLVRPRLRIGMCAALLLGAASMCVLGVWA